MVTATGGSYTAPPVTIAATVAAPGYSLVPSGAITITSGATTGNTNTITVQSLYTSPGTFNGSVALSCSISNGTEVYPPTCVITSPGDT